MGPWMLSDSDALNWSDGVDTGDQCSHDGEWSQNPRAVLNTIVPVLPQS